MLTDFGPESADTPKGAGISTALGFLTAAENAVSTSKFKITIQKKSEGNFRAIIQMGDPDVNTPMRIHAGGGMVIPPSETFWTVRKEFSQWLAEYFYLETDDFPRINYVMFLKVDSFHKDDEYIDYLSLSNDSKIIVTPKIYSEDKLDIQRIHEIILPYKIETVKEITGNNLVNLLESLISDEESQSIMNTLDPIHFENQSPVIAPAPAYKPTAKIPAVLGEKIVNREAQLEVIKADAAIITIAPASEVALGVNEERDMNRESQIYSKYVSVLTGVENIKIVDTTKFINFISYGTETTKSLGAGERAGVVNSFQSAFGNLPESTEEWQDVIKIANGRWPTQRNNAAETKAKASFKKIYGKEANMNNQSDNAAITIIAYGLRPSQRNLDSEKAAILSFKYFYKRAPVSAIDWDTVRAIAYSGAER